MSGIVDTLSRNRLRLHMRRLAAKGTAGGALSVRKGRLRRAKTNADRCRRARRLEPSRYSDADQNSRRLEVPVGRPLSRTFVDAFTIAVRTVAGEADRLFCR